MLHPIPLNSNGTVRDFPGPFPVRKLTSGTAGTCVGFDSLGYVLVEYPNPFLDGRPSVLRELPLTLQTLE